MTGPGGDKPGALLLDEMFSPAIADGLAARGIDCRAVVADALLRALSDLEIFEAALVESRIIVTNNVPDFESLRRTRDAAGGAIPGGYLHIRLHISPHRRVRPRLALLADRPPVRRMPAGSACLADPPGQPLIGSRCIRCGVQVCAVDFVT